MYNVVTRFSFNWPKTSHL